MTRRTSALPRPLGAAGGLLLDRLWGEPSTAVHPVVLFGRFMNGVEGQCYADSKKAGTRYTTVGTGIGVIAGSVLRSTSVATALAVGARSLRQAATDVRAALDHSDVELARSLLPTLVGRDPRTLDAAEMARATVESVAENTVDAIVAPALWAAVAGAAGAFGYRAINTMDAMVGHRSSRYQHFGWASARLDDVANWVPARCTAALVALMRPSAARDIRWAVRHQAPAHPSPNAGVAEAAFAAALGLRLGGRNHYEDRVEDRPPLGMGRPAAPPDIDEAVRLSRDVEAALAVILGVIGLLWWCRR